MQLAKKQKQELEKLAGYFSKIERLAEMMGIDVDEFINEYKNSNSAIHQYIRRGASAGIERKSIFQGISKVETKPSVKKS